METFLINNDKNIKPLINSFLKHWYIVDNFKDLEIYVRESKFCKTKDGITIFDILKQLNRINDIKKIYSDYEFFPLMQNLHDIIDYDLLDKLYDENPSKHFLLPTKKYFHSPLSRLTSVDIKDQHIDYLGNKPLYDKNHAIVKKLKWWSKEDFENDSLSDICQYDPSNLISDFNWSPECFHREFSISYESLSTRLISLYRSNEQYILKNNIWSAEDFKRRHRLNYPDSTNLLEELCYFGSKILTDLNLFKREDFTDIYQYSVTTWDHNAFNNEIVEYYSINNLYVLLRHKHYNIIKHFDWWTKKDFIDAIDILIEMNYEEIYKDIVYEIFEMFDWWKKEDLIKFKKIIKI